MARSMCDRLVARVSAGRFSTATIDASSTPGVRSKPAALRAIEPDRTTLESLQERLTAEGKRSLLVVLQGMDTAGKDGTIKHVIGSIDPQGSRVAAFKAPTFEERRHDFLWRIRKQLPSPGVVGVFNRSHYEDVVVVRVHGLVPERTWRARFDAINSFEREVTVAGTTIVKVFLHISYDEQRRRLLDRLRTPQKRWKFNPADLDERARWDEYQAAYGDAIARCSTKQSPWYVVPANHKWYRNYAVGRILIETLTKMNPRYPMPRLNVRALERRLQA